VKLDLENFYPAVRYSRIVAIFRSLGYSREAAIWLSRLCTSAAPATLPFGPTGPHDLLPYLPRHLPQGAPTSPALANLSTFVLDLRLSGLARAYGAVYTRYADDLTFSGSHRFAGALRDFLQISARIISQERFRVNRKKRKVLRRTSRQVVTGVVVNDRLNVDRREYDRLRAILHNCRKTGPSLQNHDSREDFRAHLRGRIAYVAAIHPARGARLLTIFNQIAWTEPR
jgi:retron-type reverse transcriptase